jgi:TolB-like protein/Flp pilus assembly protein TadD
MSFIEELKRRNVFKVGGAYVVAAWLLIQFSDIVLDNMDAPSWVLNAIMLVLAVGFAITVFVAWAFEMTPEGIKKESEVDRSQSITAQTGKKLNSVLIAMLVLAVGYIIFDKFSGPESASTPVVEVASSEVQQGAEPAADSYSDSRQSIAVLPFDNRSNREEDQFFTDGIHDDLLTTIARIGSMKVISRTSVMEYKDTTKKIPEIAAELGVANILEGGIQRSGNQVRINVQLIDAETDEHLWAEIFDRELTAENLFAIQSEISNKIADALQATLSPEEQQQINTAKTTNLDAYDAYLRGKQLMATRRVMELGQATEAFLKAVELDPSFALAWVGVADSHALWAGYSASSEADTIAIRENAINKALSINPGLGEAYASLATVHDFLDRHEEAEVAFRKAIELSPNYATAYQWYGGMIRDPLRSRERLDLAHKAVELDPRSMIIGVNLAAEYLSQGSLSRAEQQALKVTELYPDFPNGYHNLLDLHFFATGRLADAMQYARKLEALDPGSFDPLRHQADIYVAVGDLDAAREVQEKIIELNPEHYWAGWTDLIIAERSGNAPAIREAISWMQPRAMGRDWQLNNLGDSYFIAGDIDRARELYVEADPEFLDPTQWERLIKRNPFIACGFSWILLNTGDSELGQALLEQTTAYLENDLPAAVEHSDSYQPDICYLTAGETEKALNVLEMQLAHGHFAFWIYDHQLPMFDQIRLEPRYLAMREELDRKLQTQRDLIEQMDAEAGP